MMEPTNRSHPICVHPHTCVSFLALVCPSSHFCVLPHTGVYFLAHLCPSSRSRALAPSLTSSCILHRIHVGDTNGYEGPLAPHSPPNTPHSPPNRLHLTLLPIRHGLFICVTYHFDACVTYHFHACVTYHFHGVTWTPCTDPSHPRLSPT